MCSYCELPNVQRVLQYPNKRNDHSCQISAHHRGGDHHANGGNSGILLKADRTGAGSPGTRLGRPFGPGFALPPGLIGRTQPQSAYSPPQERRRASCPLKRGCEEVAGFPRSPAAHSVNTPAKSDAYSAFGARPGAQARQEKPAEPGSQQRQRAQANGNRHADCPTVAPLAGTRGIGGLAPYPRTPNPPFFGGMHHPIGKARFRLSPAIGPAQPEKPRKTGRGKVTPAGQPITRRTPNRQDKPPPVAHFPQPSPGPPCH